MSGNTLKLIIGAGLIGASFLVPGLGLAFLQTPLLFAGASLASSALRPNLANIQEGIKRNDPNTQAGLPIVYGATLVGIRPADYHVVVNNNNLLFVVGALAHGSENGDGIQAIDEIYADDRLIFNADGTLQPAFTSFFGVIKAADLGKYLGTSTQLVDPSLHSAFPNSWPTSSRGRGVAYIVLFLRFNDKVWVNGIPNFTVKLRGRKVYDPRSGVTAYSTNSALCVRDFLLSTTCGCACAPTEIDEQSFIDAANYCDEVIDKHILPGGGSFQGPRFETNGWLDPANKVAENLQKLLSACRGELVYMGGKFSLVIRKATSVTGFQLDRTNTIGQLRVVLPGVDAKPNVMEGAFVDPAQRYDVTTVQYPDLTDPNPFLAEDNNFKTVGSIQLPMTSSEYTCRQIMQVILKERRLGRFVTVNARESVLSQVVGDLIEVTNDTLAWVKQKCWITNMGLAMDGTVAVSLMTYDPAMYTADQQAQTPDQPPTDQPQATDLRVPISPVHGCVSVTGAVGTDPGFVQLSNPSNSGKYLVVYELKRSQNGDSGSQRQTFAYYVGPYIITGGSSVAGYTERRDQRDATAIVGTLTGYTTSGAFSPTVGFYSGLQPQQGTSNTQKNLSNFSPLHPDAFPIILPPGTSIIGRCATLGSTLAVAACWDELTPDQLPSSDDLPNVLNDMTMPRSVSHGYVSSAGSVSSSGWTQILNPIDSGRVVYIREFVIDANPSGSTVSFYVQRIISTGLFTVNGDGWAGATLVFGRSLRRDARSTLGATAILQGTNLMIPNIPIPGLWRDLVPDASTGQGVEGYTIIDPGSFPWVLLPGESIIATNGQAGGTSTKIYVAWDEFDQANEIVQIIGGFIPVVVAPSTPPPVSPIHVYTTERIRRFKRGVYGRKG